MRTDDHQSESATGSRSNKFPLSRNDDGSIVQCVRLDWMDGNKANNIGKFRKIINIMAEEVGQNKS